MFVFVIFINSSKLKSMLVCKIIFLFVDGHNVLAQRFPGFPSTKIFSIKGKNI